MYYILKREYGDEVIYTIIDTRTGIDLGLVFNTREEAQKYIDKRR